MPKPGWRGTLYIYNFLTREFLRHTGAAPADIRWTPGTRHARAYNNPGSAHKAAARINAILYRRDSAKYPCAPVDVITGEAARCLDLINQRKQ